MNLHDVVALVGDLPYHNPKRGQVGTVVEEWEPDVYELAFADTDGVAYAILHCVPSN